MSKTPEPIKDWRGTLVEVGDIILYAVKHSTWVEVNEAIVSETGFQGTDWNGDPKPFVCAEWQRSSMYNGDSASWRHIRRVTLRVIANLTVVEKHMPNAWAPPIADVDWTIPKVV